MSTDGKDIIWLVLGSKDFRAATKLYIIKNILLRRVKGLWDANY